MSRVTLPSSRIPLTQRGDVVSTEFYRWMHDITERVGGVDGASTTDLAASQFEDAGIEESKAELYRMRDEMRQVEGLVYALLARITALESKIMGIEQGTLL